MTHLVTGIPAHVTGGEWGVGVGYKHASGCIHDSWMG
jgi:hypothetical protein